MAENILSKSPELVVLGGSSGSLDIVLKILSSLNKKISFTLVIVLHRKNTADSSLAELFTIKSPIPVKEVEDKDAILPGHIYLAPSDYHLLFEKKHIFSLDDSEKINYSRPSIDVTFESAAEAYRNGVVAILLSGSNADGTQGLQTIHQEGGVTIVQDPATADFPYMPQHAILNGHIDHQMNVAEIINYLNNKQ